MNAKEIIKNAQDHGKPMEVWYGSYACYQERDENYLSSGLFGEFYLTREEALKAINSSNHAVNPEWGQYLLIDLNMTIVDDYIIDNVKSFGYISDDDLFNILIEDSDGDAEETNVREIYYNYDSIEGSLIVEYYNEGRNDEYYNIQDIYWGGEGETERTFVESNQYFNVIATSEELRTLTITDQCKRVKDFFKNMKFSWMSDHKRCIDNTISYIKKEHVEKKYFEFLMEMNAKYVVSKIIFNNLEMFRKWDAYECVIDSYHVKYRKVAGKTIGDIAQTDREVLMAYTDAVGGEATTVKRYIKAGIGVYLDFCLNEFVFLNRKHLADVCSIGGFQEQDSVISAGHITPSYIKELFDVNIFHDNWMEENFQNIF